jgi:hypothetical protein
LIAAQSAIGRGIISTKVKDDTISDFLLHLYKTRKLLQIHNRPELQLTEMAQYHSTKTEKNKVQRCLELVDCLFDSDAKRLRYTACSKDQAAIEEAELFFKTMDLRSVRAVVYMQGKMNEEVDNRRKPKVKGTGNAVIANEEKLESWKPHWVSRNERLTAIPRELVPGMHPNHGELFGPFIDRFFAATASKKRKSGGRK